MPDQDRAIEPEGVDHVERMQGDCEHVAQALGALEIAVSRQQWCEDMPAPGEGREERAVLGQPAGAVQEDQRWATVRFKDTDLSTASGDVEKVGANGHVAASATEDPGATRLGSGWIQKRSSLS